MDTSSLDPHMIRNGSHMFKNGVSGNLLGIAMSFDEKVATSVLVLGMAMPYDDGGGYLRSCPISNDDTLF